MALPMCHERPPASKAAGGRRFAGDLPGLRIGLHVSLLLLLLSAAVACQPGPPPTPTIPSRLNYTLTPTSNSPTVTVSPTAAPTATAQAATPTQPATLTPIVATYTPSPTPSQVLLPASTPTLAQLPDTTALPPAGVASPSPPVAAQATPVQWLAYTPSPQINPLPIPEVVRVEDLPAIPLNAGFDGGTARQGAAELVIPTGWVAWWRTGPIDCSLYQQLGTTGPCPALEEPGLIYRRPEFSVIFSSDPWLDPPRVHGQGQAARFFCTYGICIAGYLQRVQVTPGRSYVLGAWVHSWCSDDSTDHRRSQLETQDDRLNCEMAVGLDPRGGLDPFADQVVWQAAYAYDTYAYLETPPVVAQGPAMTLFLRGRSLWGLRHNDFHFDQVSFVAR